MDIGASRGLTPAETLALFPNDIRIEVVLPGQVPRWEGRPLFEQEYIESADTEKKAIAAVVRKVKRLARKKDRVKGLFVRPVSVLARADGMFMAFCSAALVENPKPVDFSKALAELKIGHSMTRLGWNGAGQYVYFEAIDGDYLPCFVLFNAQGQHQPGWIPSIADLLATDWIPTEAGED